MEKFGGDAEVDWDTLCGAAIAASARSYSPYSNFPVGVAGFADDGRLVSGANVENASYGLTLCAECSMVSHLHATGGGRLVAAYCVDGSGDPPAAFCDFSAAGDPRGIVPWGGGFLVGDSIGDDIEFVSAAGVVAAVPFVDSNGLDGINFPQQIHVLDAETIMAAGFSAPWGVYFYDNYGIGAGMYLSPVVYLSPRGCYRLDNGDFLYTGGTRIDVIDGKAATTSTIVNQLGTSFRWVNRFTIPKACPGDLDGNGSIDALDLATLLGAWGGGGAADLDGSGAVDALDLAELLGSWGPC